MSSVSGSCGTLDYEEATYHAELCRLLHPNTTSSSLMLGPVYSGKILPFASTIAQVRSMQSNGGAGN